MPLLKVNLDLFAFAAAVRTQLELALASARRTDWIRAS